MGLAKRIIPCLDVTAGRVVKGVNFVGLRDAGDPVEIARRYDEQGADELTFLDITASSDDRDLIVGVVEAVAAQVFIPMTVGGGVTRAREIIDQWIDENPIESILFDRISTRLLVAELMKRQGKGAFAAIGSLDESMSDLVDRSTYYAEYLPKIETQDNRSSVRTCVRILAAEQLIQKPLHLVRRQGSIDFDRCATRQ